MAAPVLSPGTELVGFTEGDSGTVLFPSLVVADSDSANLTGATAAIASFSTRDYLAFVDQNGITGSYDPLTGILTLTGIATVAQYEAALQSVVFMHAGDANVGGTHNTRFIYFQVSDGAEVSNSVLSALLIADGGITAGDDTLSGTPIDDIIDGLAGNDTLYGGDGNDRLKGGAGDDVMFGGNGDDMYIVDNAGDTVDESGGDGIDLVWSRVTWTAGSGIENITLDAGARDSDAFGNALDNLLTGNAGANELYGYDGADTLVGAAGADLLVGGLDDDILDGGAGNDTLDGEDGADILDGGAGADRIDGGVGADQMTGGAGNDTFVVDDESDTVVELANGGVDTIESSLDETFLVLYANVENLTLTGGAFYGGGNALNNVITANATGSIMTGEGGNDTLIGGAGIDTMRGGLGADKLTGGGARDAFIWHTAAEIDGDRILDLNFAQRDAIDFSQIDADPGEAGNQAFAFVDRFTKHAGEITLFYNAVQGLTWLGIDVDGDGRQDIQMSIVGDVTGTKDNLYTGAGDTDGGWVL